jgi:hypothetical protein
VMMVTIVRSPLLLSVAPERGEYAWPWPLRTSFYASSSAASDRT